MKNFVKQLNQLERLHSLIQRKATGSPSSLAVRLAVSQRTAYNLIDALKSLGAEINYCRTRESYYYDGDFKSNIL